MQIFYEGGKVQTVRVEEAYRCLRKEYNHQQSSKQSGDKIYFS